jgi:hypothetical protein
MSSSGSYMKHIKFNPIQIKDGKIVRLRKDGRIAAVLDTWPPTKGKK